MQTDESVENAVVKLLKDLQMLVGSDRLESPPFQEPARLQAILWLAETHRVGTSILDKEGDPDAIHVFGEMIKLSPVPTINDVLDALQARLGFLRDWQLSGKYPVLICPTSSEPPFPDCWI